MGLKQIYKLFIAILPLGSVMASEIIRPRVTTSNPVQTEVMERIERLKKEDIIVRRDVQPASRPSILIEAVRSSRTGGRTVLGTDARDGGRTGGRTVIGTEARDGGRTGGRIVIGIEN